MRDRPVLTLRVGAVLLVLAAAGCAGVPHSGSINVGREFPAAGGLGDVEPRVLPPGPIPGMSPTDIVHGFLRAMVNQDGGYEIARTYLTTRAAHDWNSKAGVTTYDDSGVDVRLTASTGANRTVLMRAPRVGLVDARGDFIPRPGTVESRFSLTRVSGQWRIDRLPDGALLSTLDAQRSFRLADVYYLNRAGTTLVPEQVLLRPEPSAVTTALVRALLAGPGPWLAPAVHTSFPAGTDLLGNVPVDPTGVAEVNLSGSVRQAPLAQLRALSAQLVWSLRQVHDISKVRLLADGSPLVLPGVPEDQPRNAWPSYDPSSPPSVSGAYYGTRGGVRTVGAAPALRRVGRLASVVVSHDGARLAGLRSGALYVGRVGQAPTRRMTAETFTRPTFDGADDVFTVATRGARRWVAEVTASGSLRTVATDGTLLSSPVQELRLSRDGARVAAVVGTQGAGRLLVGRVESAHGQPKLGGFREVLTDVRDVRGVAWWAADLLAATAADAGGGRELVAVDVDGYGTQTVPTAGLPTQPVDVAAAPGEPLLVTAGDSVWLDDPVVGWRRLGRGSDPTYAD